MGKKIKKPKRPQQENAITKAKAQIASDQGKLINFSFKYHTLTDKFSFTGQGTDYFAVLFDRIKGLCTWTTQQFYSDRSSSLRSHPIDWSDTTEGSFGIPKEDEIVDTPYQFCLTANQYGRVHGFFISNTFYTDFHV